MSHKIEVCKTCNGTGIEYDGAGHTCTACSGIAAPVVERQPKDEEEQAMDASPWAPSAERSGAFVKGWMARAAIAQSSAPPELAELQATIDRLEQQIAAQKLNLQLSAESSVLLGETADQEIAQLKAEIERLKGSTCLEVKEPEPKVCECPPGVRNITEGGHFPACTACHRRLKP